MVEVLSELRAKGWYDAPEHIWVRTSVESGRGDNRIDEIREVPAVVRFLSCEPLLGSGGRRNVGGVSGNVSCGPSGASWGMSRRTESKEGK